MISLGLRVDELRPGSPSSWTAEPQTLSFADELEQEKQAALTELDAAIAAARAAQQQADSLRMPFAGRPPASDPTAWTLYTEQQAIANQESAKAEQAIASRLRMTYGADKGNLAAAEARAHEIAYRYRDDPQAQRAVTAALETVKAESREQRATGEALHAVNRAGGRLDGLLGERADGKAVPDQALQAASDDLDARRRELLMAVEAELGHAYDAAGSTVNEPDPPGQVAQQIAGRYKEPEATVAVEAARILREIERTPADGQIQRLGELKPKSLDPTVRALVREDPRIARIEDAFITGIVAQVDGIHEREGTRKALETLRALIEPRSNPAFTPEMKARAVNRLLPTIGHLLREASGVEEMIGVDGRGTGLYPTVDVRVDLAENLSAVVDAVAAGSDPIGGRYDSDEIRAAVQGVGREIARNPNAEIVRFGFERAVGSGYVTLALEVARQNRGLTQQDLPEDRRFDAADRDRFQELLMGSIELGFGRLKENARSEVEALSKAMAPFLVPTDRYGARMTDAQLRGGMEALHRANPDIVEAMRKERGAVDDLGYKLVRSSEAVQFYRDELGDLGGYAGIDGARIDLMNTSETASAIFLSDAATLRIGAQTARKKLGDDWQLAGAPLPQRYGIGAQLAGDFTEFLAETYVVRGVRGGENMPAVEATRVAHLPMLGGAAIWGVGGGFQAALTVYLYENVKFDRSQQWREPILLGLVGGFAAFHLAEAGMAMARLRPHMFDQVPGLRDALHAKAPWIYVEPGSRRDQMTRSVVEATKPLIGALAGLMAIAVVWDASGVAYTAGKDSVKTATFGTNLTMDTVLLRLQVRELAKKILESPTLREGVYRSVLGTLATSKGLDLIEAALRRVPILGSNPIGWLVNIGYLTTTMVNWAVDQNRSIGKLEGLEKTFLMGAGIMEPQAEILKKHGWWTGGAEAAGFAFAYDALGGDPETFVDYVNIIPPDKLDATMTAVGAFSSENGRIVPDTQPGTALLRLPADPSRVNVELYSRIRYSAERRRWEDPDTGMVLQDGDSCWRYDGGLGVPPVKISDGMYERDVYSFVPEFGLVETSSPHVVPGVRPGSVDGLRNWLNAHGVPAPRHMDVLPPKPEPVEPPEPAPPVEGLNVHVVRRGDSVYGIAGNNPNIVEALYRLNPWLNPLLEGNVRPVPPRGLPGRDPDALMAGDLLVLPDGYSAGTGG
ncbi:hypothetical protein [Inquilinus sp. OTU3971]|uniref:hypothetical protein n=1 Tax=Inquilinus sp. OTU3971 TaxID=3043855 RepID=UPI00313E2D8A